MIKPDLLDLAVLVWCLIAPPLFVVACIGIGLKCLILKDEQSQKKEAGR